MAIYMVISPTMRAYETIHNGEILKYWDIIGFDKTNKLSYYLQKLPLGWFNPNEPKKEFPA